MKRIGRLKRVEGVFNRLGKDNLLHKRGHKFQNQLLVQLEDGGYDPKAIVFHMENAELSLSIDPNKLPPHVVQKIEEDFQDFEDGVIFPPSDEELKLMQEVTEEG